MLGFKAIPRGSIVSTLTQFFASSDSQDELSDSAEDDMEKKRRHRKGNLGKRSSEQSNEPDTSSFPAFLFSLLSCTEERVRPPKDNEKKDNCAIEMKEQPKDSQEESRGRGRRSQAKSKGYLRRYFHGWSSPQNTFQEDSKNEQSTETKFPDTETPSTVRIMDLNNIQQYPVPDMSDHSLLLSKTFSSFLSSALPTLVQGRKWTLLYSTWKHGISLLTLYRKSALCPGPCLIVVGDYQGAVFGGLSSSPLKPTGFKKYQGTNDTFVFTDVSGVPVLFHPTGANRYFVLCSPESLAFGGGGHFALYLDGDLLHGSSGLSETFGNSCLAKSEDFQLKEVELWGFVNSSKWTSNADSDDQNNATGLSRWLT